MKYCLCLENINFFGTTFQKNFKYKYEFSTSNVYLDEADERQISAVVYIPNTNGGNLKESGYYIPYLDFKRYFLDIDENRSSNLDKLIP